MEVIPGSLTRVSEGALDALGVAARRVAVEPSGGATERVMASAARTAIFADAVLAAMHARLEELKGVTK